MCKLNFVICLLPAYLCLSLCMCVNRSLSLCKYANSLPPLSCMCITCVCHCLCVKLLHVFVIVGFLVVLLVFDIACVCYLCLSLPVCVSCVICVCHCLCVNVLHAFLIACVC